MSMGNMRSFIFLNNARTPIFSKHAPSVHQFLPVISSVNYIRCYGTLRRSRGETTSSNRRSHVFGVTIAGREFQRFTNTRLASTFVVETLGKLTKSVEQSESVAAAAVATGVDKDPIPEPPPVPVEEFPAEAITTANTTFADLGLGGWSPVGIVENCMEVLHVDWGIPWWGSIAIGTVVVRMLLFPVVLMSQRNAAKMNNNLPQLQIIQMKMTEARQTGNHLEAARYAQELMLFMKEKQLNPLKNMLVPVAQAPIFLSFFMALRGMSNIPVPDMVTGGLWWFTDLTMPDQYFLLPLLTSATLYLTIELGTDSARLNSQNMHVMKYVLRALPICIFPFTVNFPVAVICYWLSSNTVSLVQVGILRIPAVRKYFKIDQLVHHDPQTLPNKPKGFIEGFKDSYTNMKITKEMEERERYDEIQFRRAGTAPIQKTFKHDPTLSSGAISAKKRSSP